MTEPSDANPRYPVRVVAMYATRWRVVGMPAAKELDLELGALARNYEFYKGQLPRPLTRAQIPVDELRFATALPDVTVARATVSLFALPSNQVVFEITLQLDPLPFTVEGVRTGVAAVLEQCIHGDLFIGARTLSDYLDQLADEAQAQLLATETSALLPERHLLVFVSRVDDDDRPFDRAVIEDVVYRDAPPYREEFVKLQLPDQLNQEGRTLGAVTPYVSLLYGHKQFVEDSVFLSTVQALGTSSRFRQIWHEAYRQVREFRHQNQREVAGEQTRDELEALADQLGNLEFDLTFSVEFPLIRIESFHSALYEALDLPNQTQTLSQMFTQLAGSLRSEITAIEIRERRIDLEKKRWNAAAASIISLVGVPIGFVVAFFGINATQVDGGNSMFDLHHYLWVYLFGLVLAMVPATLISYPYARAWLTAANPFKSRPGPDHSEPAADTAGGSGSWPAGRRPGNPSGATS